MLYSYIAVEGNIGAGKTTLANLIAEKYDSKLVLEEYAENPFLPPFYKEPDKFAFQLELSFLAERYQQLVKELANRNLFYQTVVSDYIIHKSLIFARSNLDKQTFQLYNELYKLIIRSMPKPELVVYLYNHTDRLLQNIAKRGRPYEQDIKAEYLSKIQRSYFSFFKQNRKLRVVVVEATELDFVNNQEHAMALINLVNRPFKTGMNHLESNDLIA
jgi:deoxyadenosine/deoxycytidine kinase